MENLLTSQLKWGLVIIPDPNNLPGKSISNIIHLILDSINFKFAIVDDLIGAKISDLVERENTIMKINDLLEVACDVVQFEWGDFFLFKEYPNQWNNSTLLGYPEIIIQTDTTVRAVDNGYIYVYTPYMEIIEMIKKNYPIESIKIDSLWNLDYPY